MRTKIYDLDGNMPTIADGLDGSRSGVRVVVPAELSVHEALAQLDTLRSFIQSSHRTRMDAVVERAEAAVGYACPKCRSGRLELKAGKFGEFFGCTNFRHGCRFTQSAGPGLADSATSQKSPEAGHQ